mgnify:CR=1 FL=1
MDLCTYHSHCNFCDGKAPAEDFVKAAIEAGFHSYGISSHSPLPFETRWSLRKRGGLPDGDKAFAGEIRGAD